MYASPSRAALRGFVAMSLIALVFANCASADVFTADWLGGTIWEQDGAWSTTAYPNNGHFVTLNGNPVPGPNPTYNVNIANAAPCTLGIAVAIDALNVAGGATLNVLNSSSVTSGGPLLISGAATLNSTNGGSQLRAGARSGVASTGVILMSDSGTNYISGSGDGYTFTINAGGVVRGAGQMNLGYFGGNEHLLNYVNHGLIEANQPNNLLQIGLGQDVGSNLTNDGTLRASGSGALRVHSFGGNGAVNNAGGTISATDNGNVRLAAPVVLVGGALMTSSNGKIGGDGDGGGSGIYKDVTNNGTMAIGNGETLRLAGTIVNNGVIRMDSTQGTGANLYFNDQTVLGGTGSLTMSNSSTNYIYGTESGNAVTLAAGATIQGAATINPGFSGTGLINFTNNGLVDANQPAGINFRIASDAGASLTNNATMRASNGSTLRFYNGSAADLLINSAGRIEALDGSAVRLGNAVTLEGGTLATSGTGTIHGDAAGGGSGTFSNVTNSGTMVVANGELMRISGNFVNNGVLRMEDTPGTGTNLYFSNTTITGSGTITLTDSGTNYIYAATNGDTLTIGPTMAVRGGAQISPGFQGTGILNVVNHGLMESTSFLRIGLFNDANTRSDMLNTGTFRAAAGATIEMHAFSQACKLTNDGGRIEVLDGSNFNIDAGIHLLQQNSGTIDLSGGTMTAPSGLDLDGGQLVGNGTFVGPVRNNAGIVAPGHSPGKITVNGSYTQGSDGVLNLEIGGNTPGSGYDQLVVNGAAALDGTLNISLINGYRPAVGDVFTIITPQSVNGEFAHINATGLDVQANYASGAITATVTSVSNLLLNISTRLRVLTGDNALIGGFIITGTESKKVIVRAIGPSLLDQGVSGALLDPTLELFDENGSIATNDDWKQDQQAEIESTGVAPAKDAEAAIVRTLPPGTYTAVVRGKNDSTGIGLVEVYDLAQSAKAKLANISSRGFVDTDDNALIGGFIAGGFGGGTTTKVVVRALGPSLAGQNVTDALVDPTLALIDANGSTVRANDDWKSDQQSELETIGIQPSNDAESALVETLPAGSYTAVVRGKDNGTGVGLVEVYNVE